MDEEVHWPLWERGQLQIESGRAALHQLAENLGTPSLVYWADRFRANVAWLRAVSLRDSTNIQIAFALKSCSHFEIARLAQRENLWCEVMSLGEYEIALKAGFSADQIVLNGLGWCNELIHRAVLDGIALVNVDNQIDLERIATAATATGRSVRVGIRIIPDVNRSMFTPAVGKLGALVRGGEAANLVEQAASTPGVRCIAISTHSCHRETDPVVVHDIARATVRFAREQQDLHGIHFEFIDIGGGLDDRVMIERRGHDASSFIVPVMEEIRSLGDSVRLLIEPGRLLIGDAGTILTKVRVIKTSGGRSWLIVDAGTNILVPIPAAHFEVHAVQAAKGSLHECSVADGNCSPASVIQESAYLPCGLAVDSLLVVGFAGAYTLSLAENWAYPVPPVALVDGGVVHTMLDRLECMNQFYRFTGVSNDCSR